jgi:CBS domain containing-hemolysin-like protein
VRSRCRKAFTRSRLGRIPDVGDDLVVDGWRLTVVRRDHNRVDVRADSRRRRLHVRPHRHLYYA